MISRLWEKKITNMPNGCNTVERILWKQCYGESRNYRRNSDETMYKDGIIDSAWKSGCASILVKKPNCLAFTLSKGAWWYLEWKKSFTRLDYFRNYLRQRTYTKKTLRRAKPLKNIDSHSSCPWCGNWWLRWCRQDA